MTEYDNADIAKLEDKEEYITYEYTGKTLSGEDYSSSEMPTEAGKYLVTVKLKETAYYSAEETVAALVIAPKPVTIISGIKAEDKMYNGTTKAILNFKDAEFEGVFDKDIEAVRTVLSDENNLKYKADFIQKDVILKDGETSEMAVNISNIEFAENENIPKSVYNYVIAENGNQTETSGKIQQRRVDVTGIKVKDKTYDGTEKAEIDTSAVKIDGHIQGEELYVDIEGTYTKTDNEEASKDVLVDKDGKISAKKVAVTISELKAKGGSAVTDNYIFPTEKRKVEMEAKILPAEVTIGGITAKDKYYDGTVNAELDFSKAEITGALENDDDVLTGIVRSKAQDYVSYKASFANRNVNFKTGADGKKEPSAIGVSIEKCSFKNKADAPQVVKNYKIKADGNQAESSAVIKPAELNSVEWKVDNKTGIPGAVYNKESGVADGDKVDVVLSFYEKADKEFKIAISTYGMVAGEIYVARVEGVDNANYVAASEFKNPIYTFAYEPKSAASQTATDGEPTAEELTNAKLKLDEGLSLTPAGSSDSKSKKIVFKWGKVPGADGYLVYTGITKEKYNKAVDVKSATSYTFKQGADNRVNKAYVKAYKLVNGKKYILSKSYGLRYAGKKVGGYNPTTISAKKKSITIKVKKTASANAYVKVKKNNKTIKRTGNAAHLKYWSTNKKIATVTSKGKIKGVKKGECYIYAMARDGKKKKIKVTVK